MSEKMKSVEVMSNLKFSSEKMQKINLFETKNLFCDVYCLRPGQEQKVHSHKGADKIYYVLDGSATIQIGDERDLLKAGRAVLAPADVQHGVRNDGDQDLSLLVIMAPNPNAARL